MNILESNAVAKEIDAPKLKLWTPKNIKILGKISI